MTRGTEHDEVDQVAEQLDQLTLLEAAQLEALQDKWGVGGSALAMAAMPGMAAGRGAPAAEEEKTEFDLCLAPKKRRSRSSRSWCERRARTSGGAAVVDEAPSRSRRRCRRPRRTT
jgi:hypothetical protein